MDNRSKLFHQLPDQASLDTDSNEDERPLQVDHEIAARPLINQVTRKMDDADLLVDPSVKDHVVFEPVTSNPYILTYTCLIIPRFGSHYLIGDLASKLPNWMQQICISFDWRLDILNVNSEYLDWGLHVPPTTPPAYFMRIIRQQTSLQILSDFPRIRRENLSNDFWSSAYLVASGLRPFPSEVINQFIRQTREQQGGNYIKYGK